MITQDDIKDALTEGADREEVANLLSFIRFECKNIGEIHDEIDEFIGEYFESQDPKSMGWVGDNGLP